MSLSLKKIPVFVHPNSLTFYLLSPNTHKQLLTLYNPYEFPVKFQVLCNAPNKYSVLDPEGSIGPQSCVDLVLRHIMPIPANCNVIDKIRVSMQDHTTKQVLGKRDIEATLLPGVGDNISNDNDIFHNLKSDRSVSDSHRGLSAQREIHPRVQSINYLISIVIGMICIIALLLPTHQEAEQITKIPSYFHLSLNIKLVFAYALGLVSMVIFRP